MKRLLTLTLVLIIAVCGCKKFKADYDNYFILGEEKHTLSFAFNDETKLVFGTDSVQVGIVSFIESVNLMEKQNNYVMFIFQDDAVSDWVIPEGEFEIDPANNDSVPMVVVINNAKFESMTNDNIDSLKKHAYLATSGTIKIEKDNGISEITMKDIPTINLGNGVQKTLNLRYKSSFYENTTDN